MAPPRSHNTSCEMERSLELLLAQQGESQSQTRGKHREGMEKSVVKPPRERQSLDKDELTNPPQVVHSTPNPQRGGQKVLLGAQCGSSWCWQPSWA